MRLFGHKFTYLRKTEFCIFHNLIFADFFHRLESRRAFGQRSHSLIFRVLLELAFKIKSEKKTFENSPFQAFFFGFVGFCRTCFFARVRADWFRSSWDFPRHDSVEQPLLLRKVARDVDCQTDDEQKDGRADSKEENAVF